MVLAVALIAALGAIVPALVSRCGPAVLSPSGRIVRPSRGDAVGRALRVRVRFADVPIDHHVWLAIRSGDLLWPKEPEIPTGHREWAGVIVHGVSGRAFALRLLAVSSAGQEFIEQWLERARRTGLYPGLTRIPGAVHLDEVDSLVPSDAVEPGPVQVR